MAVYGCKHWSDERRAEAFSLLVDHGKSASEAADMLNVRYPGSGYTRNAIIGLVHRSKDARVKGVMRARTGPSRTSRATRANKAVKRIARARHAPRPESKLAAFLRANSKPLPPQGEADVARVSFADLEPAKHCRFIPGDPAADFKMDKPMYYGLPPLLGMSYCHAHTVRCHSPPALHIRVTMPAKEREMA